MSFLSACQSVTFKTTSRNLARAMCMKNLKLTLVIVLVCVVGTHCYVLLHKQIILMNAQHSLPFIANVLLTDEAQDKI